VHVLYLEKGGSWPVWGVQLFALRHLTSFWRRLSLFQQKINPTAVSANCRNWRSPLPHAFCHFSMWLPWSLWLSACTEGLHITCFSSERKAIIPAHTNSQVTIIGRQCLCTHLQRVFLASGEWRGGVGWTVYTVLLVKQVVAVMQFWLRDVRSLPYAHYYGVRMLSDCSYITAKSQYHTHGLSHK